MEVKVRHIYAQPVDTVFKAFGNKASIERKFKDLGARNIHVEKCKLTKTSLDLVTSREVPVNAPSLLKKLIGEWNLANQQEQWRGTAGKSYQGHATISIKGVPVTITAKMVLASSGKGCTNDVTLTIESSIPFIGGKLAEFVGQTSATELQRQYAHIKASLASAPPAAKTAIKKPASPKPVAKAADTKPVKTPAAKPPAKKPVVAKVAVAKPAVKAVGAKPVTAKRATNKAGEQPGAKSATTVKPVAAKPAAKAIAAKKPAAKKVAKKTAVSKPAAKKAATKLAAKPAMAKKSAPKKKSE